MRACAALLLGACAALAALAPPRFKRADGSPMPFVMAVRYGRSPPRVMHPRNDRYFLAGRYGKRSPGARGPGLCRCSPFTHSREPLEPPGRV